MSSVETVSWRAVLSGPKAGLFVVLCFGVWLHAADSTVIATLMPSVVAEIGGEAFISWNYVLYRLAAITAACCAAILARRVGFRRAMVWSALAVGLGCAISAATPVMAGMLVGRTIQGIGGGLLVALTAIGVGTLFPSNFSPRVMAAISAVWGSSAFLGPLIGGIFAEMGEWRWGFWAFTVQALILAAALHWALPERTAEEETRAHIPWRRLTVLALSIMAVAIAGLGGGTQPVVTTLLCLLGAVGMVLFLRLDREAGNDTRLMPRAVADISHVAGAGFIALFLISMSVISFTVYGPILLSILHDVGPLAAGYMIATESVSWTIGALAFSGFVGAAQTRVLRYGFLIIAVSVVGQVFFIIPGPVWALLPLLFLAGLGFGALYGHLLQRCMEAVPEDDRDRAAGAITTVQTIGYAMGAAICGLIANTVGFGSGASFEAAQAAGNWVFAAMILPALAAVLLARRI